MVGRIHFAGYRPDFPGESARGGERGDGGGRERDPGDALSEGEEEATEGGFGY